MKILITGGNGQVAFDLQRIAKQKHITFYAPSKDELQIADRNSVGKVMKNFHPNVIINTAAYTRVDQAESDTENAYSANFHGAKNLAVVATEAQCLLIHLSTDYVFNGESQKAYCEIDKTDPINQYGKSKWMGEEAVQQYAKRFIILRVSGVFGVHGNNFVKTILKLARENNVLRIVSDQITCPTPAKDIAETLLGLSQCANNGVYHYCGSEPVSWYEFAKTILMQANMFEPHSVTVEPILAKDYKTAAKRPLFSVLNCEKIAKTFNIHQPNWKAGLQNVITELYSM